MTHPPQKTIQAPSEPKVTLPERWVGSRFRTFIVWTFILLLAALALSIFGCLSPLSKDASLSLAESRLKEVAAKHGIRLEEYIADHDRTEDPDSGSIYFRWSHKQRLAPPIYVSVLTKGKTKIRVFRECIEPSIETISADQVPSEKCKTYKTPY